MNAAIVAVPTLITAAVLMPARIVGSASGSCTCAQRLARRQAERQRRLAPCPPRHRAQAGVGVAHDRQQRVEEQRDQRRARRRCCRRSAIRNASSASDGIVCSTADRAEQRAARSRGQRQAAMPSGTPTATASASEPNTSSRCSPSSAAEVGGEQRARAGSRAARRAAAPARGRVPPARRSAARDLGEAAAVELDRARSCAIIVAASMRPSSAGAAAARVDASARISSTAS